MTPITCDTAQVLLQRNLECVCRDGTVLRADVYHPQDNGRYPTSTEGLGALAQRPDGASTWNGPYLNGNSVPKDPWGRPYVYKFPGQQGAYDIVSLGPEGREGDSSIAAATVTGRQQ